MGQELIIPDSFKGKAPAKAFAAAGINPNDDRLSAGIGQSYGIVGYKGKVWSLRYRGGKHNILRPDDGTPSNFLDVVILAAAPVKSKSYYQAYDINASEGSRPTCSSIDGLLPDADVVAKQAETCALCPRNEWRTQANGKKGKECQDYKRLAVIIMPYQTAPLFDNKPLIEPVFLRVPPASLNSLSIMGDTMADQGFHHSMYITRITFDPNEAHPKMVFRPLQGLSDQEAPVIIELLRDPSVKRITTGDVVLGGPSPSTPEPSTPTAPSSLTVSNAAQPATNTGQTATLTGTATIKPASTVIEPDTTGFGGATSLAAAREASLQNSGPQPGQQSTTISQTVEDTGEPEASDVDLDAKIAGLING